MLKQYAVEDLREGMVLGRSIYEEDSNVLIGAGTVLTNQMIFSLLERPIFNVYIEMAEAAHQEKNDEKVTPTVKKKEAVPAIKVRTIPEKTQLLDASYVQCYEQVFAALRQIFDQAARSGSVDMESVRRLGESGQLMQLCDGAKAVTQIHNMVREGDYLLHHSVHVAILAGLMGRWLHLPKQQLQKLMVSGLLHDIGKLRISNDILNKPGKLTLTELKVVQRHPVLSYEMLSNGPMASEKEILSGALQHHERNDGSGYPQGSHKRDIGDFGRILAILDVYDAMAANRAYAKKRSPFEVFGVLSDDIMTGRLDTEYGILFIRQVCHALNGNWVKLTTGEKAKMVYIDETRLSALPVVQTMSGDFIDLNTNPSIRIECLLTHEEIEE